VQLGLPFFCGLVSATAAFAQSRAREQGINDPLVIAKCGTCHTRDP